MKIYKSCEEIKIFYFVYTYTYMYYCLNISITLRTCRRTKGGLDIMLIKRVERLAERLYERLLKVKVSFPNCQGDSGEESGKNGYLHLDRSWISEFYTTRVGIYS